MLNLNPFPKKYVQYLKGASFTESMIPWEQQEVMKTSKKSFSRQVIYGNKTTQPAFAYKSSSTLYPDLFMTSSHGMFKKVHGGGLFYLELNTL